MANDNLRQAKAAKNDEFYTQYDDIAAELKHYSTFLREKIVFCNCDDPTWSNFWKYLHNNFSVLGLKKLISTHYEPDGSPSYKMEYKGGDDLNTEVGTVTPLKGNGDFRSEECIELLRSSDVVITNPPFSIFREYLQTIIEQNKNFIIIGSMNAAHNKDMFPLIMNNKVWMGCRSLNRDMYFNVPDSYKEYLLANKKEGSAYKIINNVVMGRLASACWYTNIDIKKRHQPFFPPEDAHCYYEGNEDKYPKYVNYDGIDVAKTELIPIDYTGYMGVPISFLDKYNPDDFEIIGSADGNLGISIGISKNLTEEQVKSFKKENPGFRRGNVFYRDQNGVLKKPFSRIIIRNRHPVAKKDDI